MRDDDRQPQDDNREGVAGAPCRSQARCRTPGPFLGARNERRDGHQMVGVERMAQTENCSERKSRQEIWTIHWSFEGYPARIVGDAYGRVGVLRT
jgi:hypothetical protein